MPISLHSSVNVHDVCIHYLVHTPYVHSCVSLPHLGVYGFTVAHALVPVAHALVPVARREVCLKVAHPHSCCALRWGFPHHTSRNCRCVLASVSPVADLVYSGCLILKVAHPLSCCALAVGLSASHQS